MVLPQVPTANRRADWPVEPVTISRSAPSARRQGPARATARQTKGTFYLTSYITSYVTSYITSYITAYHDQPRAQPPCPNLPEPSPSRRLCLDRCCQLAVADDQLLLAGLPLSAARGPSPPQTAFLKQPPTVLWFHRQTSNARFERIQEVRGATTGCRM